MSDETFALTNAVRIPNGVDRGWFLLWITWLDELYWVVGATLGGIFGDMININLRGLGFALTAMFTAIFVDNWLCEKNHLASISGLVITGLCLVILGKDMFLIPSMAVILIFLTLVRHHLESQKGGEQ